MAEKRVFSPDQTSAIETRDRTLLVSAAAGSGKTTTLTERIIRSLLDEKNPESLQNMLIVTFTNASVGDLVKKIKEALEAAVSEHPENKRLENELYLLPSAKIRTIDAFCNEILRSNTDKCGVPPNYRIAESAEIRILSASLLDAMITAAHEGGLEGLGISADDFEQLTEALTDTKSQAALREVFLSLYDKSKNAVEGVGIFYSLADKYLAEDGFAVESTEYGKDLMTLTKDTLQYLSGMMSSLATKLIGGTPHEVKDASVYTAISMSLSRIRTASYNEAREDILAFTFPGMPSSSADDKTEAMLKYRTTATALKGVFSDLGDKFYVYTEDMWHTLYERLHKTLTTLARFLELYDKAYVSEKIRREMLEYSDIEKFAYDCLYEKDGSLTEIAKSYRSSLTSIYIDEYQDVNELQDAIFAALSNGKNRFMVGDIKQSIYVFRSAKPEIFASMKDSFKRLAESTSDDDGAAIFMSENYRCDRGVIDFVNGVFDRMFTAVKDSIGYVDEDRLAFAKKYKSGIEPPYTPAEIFVIDRPESGAEEKSGSPKFIAKKIRELIDSGTLGDGSPVRASDIAIVLRKRDGIAAIADAIEAEGIKADRGIDQSFFMNSYVRLVLCLLNAIDNPSKDIYLAGLMCSPIFAFTADEMLRYKEGKRDATLYRAILDYAGENADEKLQGFLKKLSHWRTLSESLTVYDLISRLYRECGLLTLAAKGESRDNLIVLYNYARKYESSSYKGLYNFITYVNNIVELGESIQEKSDTGADDSVKITTVHSSKGLEYPIVFFAEAHRLLQNRDTKNTVAYSEGYGMAYYLRTDETTVLAENPAKHIIQEKMREKYFEEELRVLYVALTRARERLYIVGDLPRATTFENYVEKARMKGKLLTSYSVRQFGSFLEMMLAVTEENPIHFIKNEDTVADIENAAAETSLGVKDVEVDSAADVTPEKETGEIENGAEEASPDMAEGETAPESIERNEELYLILKERFDFVYPDKYKTDFPEKLSVSRLYPTVLDGADEGDDLHEPKAGEVVRRRRVPEFISGTKEDESAERGIATHMILQFCDLENLYKNGGACEIKRLIDADFLSKKRAALVREEEIELFRKSKLFESMRCAKKLYRELRFNTRLDASLFTENDERTAALQGEEILVQGVIDCIIIDDSGDIHLVDYKTDRLSKKELESRELATWKMNEKHSLQLTYYALAIEKIFGKRPRTVSVYSMPLGDTLPIKTKL